MLKNTAGQKVTFFAFSIVTGLPVTGDAGNLSASVRIGGGATALLADQSCEELSDTLAKGLYSFNVSQAETNNDNLVFSCQSTTPNVSCIPQIISTSLPFSAQVGAGAVDVVILTEEQTTHIPIDGVEVWITTDEDGLNIVAGTLVSDTNGLTKFKLDNDTVYWVHRQRAGFNFSPNPEMLTVGTP